jgi:hypothetical protein
MGIHLAIWHYMVRILMEKNRTTWQAGLRLTGYMFRVGSENVPVLLSCYERAAPVLHF